MITLPISETKMDGCYAYIIECDISLQSNTTVKIY